MAEKHLIVFGDDAEKQIRKHSEKLKSYREAQWLYDGLLYQEDLSDFDIIDLVFKDPKFAPDALIDNGKWIVPALFGNNQKIWQEAIRHCFTTAEAGKINCYTFFTN
ncbi:MAG: hypothetical protein EOP07_20345 [Proteobacteria bacterium]|nr:MAG: hypothetical protein EOP07_20345 [Pseudomonadota bacterium]